MNGVFSGVLLASARDGVAVVASCGSGWSLDFVGASCIASAAQGTDGLKELQFSPDKGVTALVAMVASYSDEKRGSQRVPGLVALQWDDDKLVVSFEQFVCSKDRLAQVTPGSDLIVTTRGQKFGTCHDRYDGRGECFANKKADFLAKGIRIANDANLLCRYLVGQATFEQLALVASGDVRSSDRVWLNAMRTETVQLREELGHAISRGKADGEFLTNKNRQIMELLTQVSGLEKERDSFKARLDRTFGARIKRWWASVVSWSRNTVRDIKTIIK